jgi:hypothetical protein
MRLALRLALLALTALPLRAQRPERPPTTPDAVLAPGPTDQGFLEWRTRVAERGRVGASYLVDGARYQVLVMTPMAIDALRQDSLIVKATKGCQKALTLTDAQVRSTAAIDPWAPFDSAARARPLVTIAVYPKEQRRYDCHAGTLARFAALSRGTLYGMFGTTVPEAQVATAELRRDGLAELTPLTGRAPVTTVTQNRIMTDGREQVRLWVDPQAFSPDAEGRVPPLELHVFNPVDDEPEVLPLPTNLIRAVWQQMLPWQARTLVDDGQAVSDDLTRLLFLPRPPHAEIRSVMLRSATAFSRRGRDPEALSLITDVMEVYPCLTFAEAVPANLREMADAVRRPARCTAIPLPLVALRAAVPGFGQATSRGRTRLALAVLGGTALSYVAANQFRQQARADYQRYLAYDGSTEVKPPALFRQAQQGRLASQLLTVTAVTIWSGAAVEAVWHEWRHRRALAEVRRVGPF